jgi:hypothetical protein
MDEVGYEVGELSEHICRFGSHTALGVRELGRMVAEYACSPSAKLPGWIGDTDGALTLSEKMIACRRWSELCHHLHPGQIGLLSTSPQGPDIVFVVVGNPPPVFFHGQHNQTFQIQVAFLPLRRCREDLVIKRIKRPNELADILDHPAHDRLPSYSIYIDPRATVHHALAKSYDDKQLEALNIVNSERRTIIRFVELPFRVERHPGGFWALLAQHFAAPSDPHKFHAWKANLAAFLNTQHN